LLPNTTTVLTDIVPELEIVNDFVIDEPYDVIGELVNLDHLDEFLKEYVKVYLNSSIISKEYAGYNMETDGYLLRFLASNSLFSTDGPEINEVLSDGNMLNIPNSSISLIIIASKSYESVLSNLSFLKTICDSEPSCCFYEGFFYTISTISYINDISISSDYFNFNEERDNKLNKLRLNLDIKTEKMRLKIIGNKYTSESKADRLSNSISTTVFSKRGSNSSFQVTNSNLIYAGWVLTNDSSTKNLEIVLYVILYCYLSGKDTQEEIKAELENFKNFYKNINGNELLMKGLKADMIGVREWFKSSQFTANIDMTANAVEDIINCFTDYIISTANARIRGFYHLIMFRRTNTLKKAKEKSDGSLIIWGGLEKFLYTDSDLYLEDAEDDEAW